MFAVFAWKPGGLSLLEVCPLLTAGGTGLGAMYPVTTTIVQNSVAPHQLGTATGALNFARQLGGAIIVAAFGTIVLGGIDTGSHGLTLEMLRGGAHAAGADFGSCSAASSRRERYSSRRGWSRCWRSRNGRCAGRGQIPKAKS